MSYDDSKIINNKYDLIKCLSVLIFVVLGFLTHSIFHIEPYVISLFGAFILMLLLKENPEHLFKDVEWNTLFFFIGLFILVGGLIESNVIKFLALKIITLTSGNFLVLIFTILLMSAILSAIVDNIPYVLTVIPIIKQIGPVIVRDLDPHVILVDKSPYMYALWWALSLGACLGGNGTIVGASANVIMAGLAKKNGYELSFKKFLRYGLLTTGLSILICIIYLYIKYYKLF
jgi:Na+/H+ antiporter NhaD/arsenite permease-like protein